MNETSNRDLLKAYYESLTKKKDLDFALSDDFKFVGGDMTKTEPLIGKLAYAEVIKRFSKLFTSVRVKEMILEGDHAFVQANYDYTFPNGKIINGDVAELWKIKGNKLDALTIFFDTLSFQNLVKP